MALPRSLWLVALLAAAALAQTSPPASPQPPSQPPQPAPSMRDLMNAAAEKQRAAAAVQREAAQKQAAAAGVRLPPWGAASADPSCDPIAVPIVTPLIESAAKAHDLAPNLIRAVIERESGFRPCAVSPAGAQGLMQLMPETSDRLHAADPFDPAQNIEAGASFLKELIDKYKGNLSQALGAYNAGPGAVDQAGGIPPIQETRDYVDAILKSLEKDVTIHTPAP